MMLGICKLCNEEKELRKSHVIPRAVFKRALKGFNYGRILDHKYNKVINTQDQWATYLLCAGCEHELNVNYEKYALDVLRNNHKGVKHQEKEDFLQIVNVDQNRLILYLISILWRAIESRHEIFNNLDSLNIALSIRELFRVCIKEKTIPSIQFFSIRISKLVTTVKDLQNIELNFISNFVCKADIESRVRFLIIFEGYCFEIFLHTNANDRLKGLGLLRRNKRILKLPRVEAFSIPELNKNLVRMIDAHNNK